LCARGRQKQRVEDRSLAIHRAVREWGLTGISCARRYHLTQPSMVHAAQKGEKIDREGELPTVEFLSYSCKEWLSLVAFLKLFSELTAFSIRNTLPSRSKLSRQGNGHIDEVTTVITRRGSATVGALRGDEYGHIGRIANVSAPYIDGSKVMTAGAVVAV